MSSLAKPRSETGDEISDALRKQQQHLILSLSLQSLLHVEQNVFYESWFFRKVAVDSSSLQCGHAEERNTERRQKWRRGQIRGGFFRGGRNGNVFVGHPTQQAGRDRTWPWNWRDLVESWPRRTLQHLLHHPHHRWGYTSCSFYLITRFSRSACMAVLSFCDHFSLTFINQLLLHLLAALACLRLLSLAQFVPCLSRILRVWFWSPNPRPAQLTPFLPHYFWLLRWPASSVLEC